jgi:dihydroorotate dehydrogenase electron transfer subunit
MPAAGEKPLLIGGGVGIAPMLLMSKELKERKVEAEMLFGFRSAERIPALDDFRKYGTVHITTEDGSVGEKGYVTQHSLFINFNYDRIYCCGPDPMMKAVAGWARQHEIFCEVSLENLMGCGFGACLCCTVNTVKGNQNSCTDGPVFNINDLKW